VLELSAPDGSGVRSNWRFRLYSCSLGIFTMHAFYRRRFYRF